MNILLSEMGLGMEIFYGVMDLRDTELTAVTVLGDSVTKFMVVETSDISSLR